MNPASYSRARTHVVNSDGDILAVGLDLVILKKKTMSALKLLSRTAMEEDAYPIVAVGMESPGAVGALATMGARLVREAERVSNVECV